MISEYLVAVWSHSPRYGGSSVKYYECGTHDEAQTFAKREAEYLDTIGQEYEINIYINENAQEKKCDHYRMCEIGPDHVAPVCVYQKGWPRAHCNGNKSRCPYIHKGGNETGGGRT